MSFRLKMEHTSKNRESKIILALDFPFEEPRNRRNILHKAEHILEAVHPYVCAVKFNLEDFSRRHMCLKVIFFVGRMGERRCNVGKGEGILLLFVILPTLISILFW